MRISKFSKVIASVLALIMVLTSIPVLAMAADPNELNIQDGEVVLFSDMSEDQVKQQLFNALVTNKEGYNYQDYEWEYGCNGYRDNDPAHWMPKWQFASVNGATIGSGAFGQYRYPALKDNTEVDESGTWQIRLAGREDYVRASKTALHVNYNYDSSMGHVLVNDSQVEGAVTVSSLNDIKFKVVATQAGMQVKSVTMNGEPVNPDENGFYTLSLDSTNLDVNIDFVKEDLIIQDGKVVLFRDMNEDQVKQQLFNALATNPAGHDYKDYEWEGYTTGKYMLYTWDAWGSINGFQRKGENWYDFAGYYDFPALKNREDAGGYKVRIAGTMKEVLVEKVSYSNVTYNYDSTMGKVLVNDKEVSGAVKATSSSDLNFKIVPEKYCKVTSVKVNGTVVSPNEDGVYTFVPSTDVKIDVEFVKEIPSFDITVEYSDLGTVTLDEQVVPKEGLTVSKTDKYTLKATANDGAKFVGWTVNGKLVSTDAELTVTPYQDITYVPVFEIENVTDKFTVTFLDCWNNIVSSQEVSNGADIKIPQGIDYNGYTFKGWSLSDEQIRQLTTSTTITAVVEKSQKGFNLTAGDAEVTFKEVKDGEGNLICGKLENGQYLYDTEITVTKDGATSWYINDSTEPVAFGNSFTFFIGSDTTVTYKTDAAEDRTTVAGISASLIEGSTYKVSFLATRHIGAKDTIVSSGFVYGKNMNESDLVLEKVGDKGSKAESGTIKSAYSNTLSTDAQMSLNYGISSATGTACARPFVVIKDAAGTEKVVYGSMMTYNYTK